MIIIFLEYVNDSLRTHFFNTVGEVFAAYFEKILQAYEYSKKINSYTSPKMTTASQPDNGATELHSL